MKRTKKATPRVPDQLAEAFLDDCLKRVVQYFRYAVAGGHYQSLLNLDPEVAKAAVKAFRTPEGAAFWLIRGAKELGGRIPLEVARTREGAVTVVHLMQSISSPGYACPEKGLAALISAEGGCVNVDKACRLYRQPNPAMRRTLIEAVRKGDVIGYTTREKGRYGVPVWQFRPEGGLIKGLREVLRALRAKVPGCDELYPFAFFLQPDMATGGRTPLAALRDGEIKKVLDAVNDRGH